MEKQFIVIRKEEGSETSMNALVTVNEKEAVRFFYSYDAYAMEVWENNQLVETISYSALQEKYPTSTWLYDMEESETTIHGVNLRCVCGYGHFVNERGAVMSGQGNGNKPFLLVPGISDDLQLYACPNCGTIKIEQPS